MTVDLPDMSANVLVVGDAILDEYLTGNATRLSREAAVPVLERTRRTLIAGGAANPAAGIVALGGQATLVSIVGEDGNAATLSAVISATGVTPYLIPDPSRPTTLKTRLLAEGGFVYAQHLARIDHLVRHALAPDLTRQLLERLTIPAPTYDIILVSDYKNGVVGPELIKGLRQLRAETGLPLVVDSQGDLELFRGFDLVKCNRAEAEAYLGLFLETQAEQESALAHLRDRIGAEAVVVTLGAEGLVFYDADGFGAVRDEPVSVYDVTGAGDTVIAVLALAVAKKLPLLQACRIATAAASLTVRVMGNYAPTRAEIRDTFEAG